VPAPACSGHGSASRSGHRRGGESREPPHSSLQSRADRPAAGHVVIRPRTRDRSGRLRRPVAGQCACRSSAGLGGSALPGPVAAQRCSAERSRGGVSRAATQPPAGAGRGGTDLRCRYLVGGRSGQTGGTGVTSLNCRTGVSQWPSAMRRVTGPQQHRPCGSCVPCCAAAPTMARSLSGPRPYGRPGPRLRHGADSYCLTRPAGDGRARSSPAVCQRRTPSAATDRTRWDRSLPRPGRLQSHWRADDGAATQARSRRRAFGPPPDSSTPAAPPELGPKLALRLAHRLAGAENDSDALHRLLSGDGAADEHLAALAWRCLSLVQDALLFGAVEVAASLDIPDQDLPR